MSRANARAAAALLIGLSLAGPAASQAIPPAPHVVEFLDGKFSMLAADYRYVLDGEEVVIPRGFVTDFASVPGALHSAFGPHGRYSRAAIVHDFLYWAQPCTREQADNIMQRIMIESGVDAVTRTSIFKAVDWFGAKAWNSNRRERESGDSHFVPRALESLADSMTWEETLRRMRRDNVRDPLVSVSARFCAIGNPAR